jgi:single-strand DNA-binding protein
MFNKVILAGNMARDVEMRYLTSGTAAATAAIATNRRYKASDGTQKDETMFIDVTFWGRTAEIANQYLKKGSQVLVEGRLTLEQWTATDGSKRSKHAIAVETLQMLGGRAYQEAKQEALPEATSHSMPAEYENIPF